MHHTDTIFQIQSGLWAIEPFYALAVRGILEQLSKGNTASLPKKTEMGASHYLVNEYGQPLASSSLKEIPSGTIGVLNITGPMFKYGNWWYWGTDELVAKAKYFDNHPNVIGQIWKNDSGGGGYNSIAPYIDFHSNRKKPVVSLCDVSASANLYINLPSDHVMAENNISSMFGSIGIMATLRDYSKMMEEYGIKEHEIYSTLSDHKNQEVIQAFLKNYKPMREIFLNPAAKKFQEHTKQFRPNLKTNVEGILKGRMFYAEDALEFGLIDSIGNFEKAVEKVQEISEDQNFMSNY